MKILVIGHSVLDFIKSGKNDKVSPGGIFYTISALNRIVKNGNEIVLCSQYDEETYPYFQSEFSEVKKDYLRKVERIPRVHLNLFKDKERHESYENITDNLVIDINDFNKFDGILINMITGFDITLQQLETIRENYKGLIFIDVHTLSRGLGENYKREFRKIPEFYKWAECVDIIQANQLEIYTLSDKTEEKEIAAELLKSNLRICCVTKGDSGAEIYFKKSGKVKNHFVAANKINNPNVIGCGDVFGATFFYNYISSGNEIESLTKAVQTAEQHVNNKFLV